MGGPKGDRRLALAGRREKAVTKLRKSASLDMKGFGDG